MHALSAPFLLQDIMHNPGGSKSNDKDHRLMKLLEGSTISHKQHVQMRSQQLNRITERVAANIDAHERLTQAEREAEAAHRESARVAEASARNREGLAADRGRHLKALVTNAQLQGIAKEQAAELARLKGQLDDEKKKVYPMLAPPIAASRPVTAATGRKVALPNLPDLRLPNIGGEQQRPATTVPGQRKPSSGKRMTISR